MYKVVTLTRFRRDLAPREARRFWAEEIARQALTTVPTLRRYLQDHWMEDLAGRGHRALPFRLVSWRRGTTTRPPTRRR